MPPKKKQKKVQLAPLPLRLFASHVSSLSPARLAALTSTSSLSPQDLYAAYGLFGSDQEGGKERCGYGWKEDGGRGVRVEGSGEKAKGGKKGKGKEGCEEGRCADDPRCLNHLEQARWQDEESALRAFKKVLGVSHNPSSDDRDPSLPVGLRNLDATCYINSLLQCWFQDLPFRAALYACTLPSNGKVDTSPLYQLQATFTALQMSRKKVYDPEPLVKSLKLDTSEQQDAQEFSKLFMTLLDTEFRKQADPRVQTLVADEFQGRMKYGTKCLRCHNRSEKDSTFLELEVMLAKKCSLEAQIGAMLESETLEGDNQYACGPCGKKRNAERYTQIISLPPVLHVSLLRFTFDFEAMERRKSKHAIDFPLSLDMSPFVVDAVPGELMYDLKGILLHKGASAHHGHYTTQVFDVSQRKWFNFDDESVTRLTTFDEPDVYDETAAIEKQGSSKSKKSKAARAKDKDKNADLAPGRSRTTDAYMLIYTRRTASTLKTADPSAADLESSASPPPLDRTQIPDPPALAAAEIEKRNEEHEEAKRNWQSLTDSCQSDFEKAKADRMAVWSNFEPEAIEPFVLAPADQIKSWVTYPLDLKSNEAKPTPKSGQTPAAESTPAAEEKPAMNGSTSEADKFYGAKSSDPVTSNSDPMDVDSDLPEALPIPSTSNGTPQLTNGKSSEEKDNEVEEIQGAALFVCQHGGVQPKVASRLKRISAESAAAIEASKPDNLTIDIFDPSRLCLDCVWGMFADQKYSQLHSKALAEFEEAMEGRGEYWISKAWLADWRKRLPDMHVPGQADDPAPNAPQWIDDVQCEHGSLQPILAKRYQITAEAAAVLQTLFPQWTSFDSAESVCEICRAENEGMRTAMMDAKGYVNAEKTKLKGLYAVANKSKFVVPSDGLDYAIVPAGWVHAWYAWMRDPLRNERPGPVDNSTLYCQHGLVVLDVSSNKDLSDVDHVAVIPQSEWRQLVKLYPTSGPALCFTAGDEKPEELSACVDCRDVQRRAFTKTHIMIRVLDPKAHETPADGKPPVRKADAGPVSLVEPEEDEDFIPTAGRKRRTSPTEVRVYGSRKSRRLEQATVKKAISKEFRMDVARTDDIKSIKLRLQDRFNIPGVYQHLYFQDRELDSSETLAAVGVGPGDTLDMLSDNVDDEDFDLSKLTDADVPRRRNGRAEGFTGSGLVGFEDFQSSDDPMSDGLEEPVAVEPEPTPGTCPTCTFANDAEAEACEMCSTALGIISTV